MSRYREFDEYEKLIKERLSKKRFTHSMNVAEACYDLAERFGADKKRCYLAGLLHDIMKEEPRERQKEAAVSPVMELDSAELSTPALWHGPAGAAYVREELKIDDDEIIRAIRFHTVGCAGMTLLEKIVYLGDMISDDRNYKDVDKFRKICYDDVDRAMSVALIYSVENVCGKCGALSAHTFEAYNYYLRYNSNKERL